MKVSWILAAGENGVIGCEGGLPWKLPDDMKIFRRVTAGKTVLMGRKTFDSIGKPLPNRTNLVVSRKIQSIPGCRVFASVQEAVDFARASDPSQELMIIGGEQIYEATLDLIDRVYLTRVAASLPGNAFCDVSHLSVANGWELVGETLHFKASDSISATNANQYDFCHQVWERRPNVALDHQTALIEQ